MGSVYYKKTEGVRRAVKKEKKRHDKDKPKYHSCNFDCSPGRIIHYNID
jgi:hypothetical protein